MENDEEYKRGDGTTDWIRESPIKAYQQPCLRPIDYMGGEASAMQGLMGPMIKLSSASDHLDLVNTPLKCFHAIL